MHVLVTGSSGLVGGAVAERLLAGGHEVVPFDIAAGQDIMDRNALTLAATGADAVVHAAALLGGPDLDPDEVFRVNTFGTYNAIEAARAAGAGRFVFLSSVNVLGCFRGEDLPDAFPISDRHALRTRTSYGVAKLMGEEMCRAFALSEGATAIALRPPAIWTAWHYERVASFRASAPENEGQKWEYGAMIDWRDMADTVIAALFAPVTGFHAMLTVADRIASDRLTRDLVADYAPGVPWSAAGWCAEIRIADLWIVRGPAK